MAEIKLRNCPICNSKVKLVDEEYSYIYCFGCGTHFSSPAETVKELVEWWNTRKPMDRIVERLETEKEFADEEKRRCTGINNSLHYQIARGYEAGMVNAIEIVKEEYDICLTD